MKEAWLETDGKTKEGRKVGEVRNLYGLMVMDRRANGKWRVD